MNCLDKTDFKCIQYTTTHTYTVLCVFQCVVLGCVCDFVFVCVCVFARTYHLVETSFGI